MRYKLGAYLWGSTIPTDEVTAQKKKIRVQYLLGTRLRCSTNTMKVFSEI